MVAAALLPPLDPPLVEEPPLVELPLVDDPPLVELPLVEEPPLVELPLVEEPPLVELPLVEDPPVELVELVPLEPPDVLLPLLLDDFFFFFIAGTPPVSRLATSSPPFETSTFSALPAVELDDELSLPPVALPTPKASPKAAIRATAPIARCCGLSPLTARAVSRCTSSSCSRRPGCTASSVPSGSRCARHR